MQTFSLALPWPPTANTNVRHGVSAAGKRVHYRTLAYERFRADVFHLCLEAGYNRLPMFPRSVRLQLTIHATPPDKRERDLDNIVKPIQDALQYARIYERDSQIDDLRILRMLGKPGTVNVFIAELHPDPAALPSSAKRAR